MCAPAGFSLSESASTTRDARRRDDRATTRSGDWDPAYYKAECNVGETITGVSQAANAERRMARILCSPIDAGVAADPASCVPLSYSSPGDRRLSDDSGEWAYGYKKNECRPDQLLQGVSIDPSTGKLHALLCCDAVSSPL
ncbi:hypothetical protein WME94_25825 [Sorangium sp. So ce429]